MSILQSRLLQPRVYLHWCIFILRRRRLYEASKVTAEHLTRMSDKEARYERTVLMMSQLLIARDMICFVQFTFKMGNIELNAHGRGALHLPC